MGRGVRQERAIEEDAGGGRRKQGRRRGAVKEYYGCKRDKREMAKECRLELS